MPADDSELPIVIEAGFPLEMNRACAGGDDGLDDFFARIGRPRKPGEPAPEPFPRPENVEQIERDTVFRPL